MKKTRFLGPVLFAVLLCCGLAPSFAQKAPRILDMTFPYDGQTIYWPTAKPFELKSVADGMTEKGYYYASNDYGASEHGGTHADAPRHFAQGGRTIEQVPLEEWIGPAAVVDVRQACRKDRNYLLTVADLQQWEKKHGRLPRGCWVIMYTGVDTEGYPDRRKVLGTDKTGPAALPELSFPGFGPEAAEWLVKERDIAGIALDTPSIDNGPSKDFRVHRVVCGANKLALENIAGLDKLPPRGATLYVIPMSIRGGSGAPARVFAALP